MVALLTICVYIDKIILFTLAYNFLHDILDVWVYSILFIKMYLYLQISFIFSKTAK